MEKDSSRDSAYGLSGLDFLQFKNLYLKIILNEAHPHPGLSGLDILLASLITPYLSVDKTKHPLKSYSSMYTSSSSSWCQHEHCHHHNDKNHHFDGFLFVLQLTAESQQESQLQSRGLEPTGLSSS